MRTTPRLSIVKVLVVGALAGLSLVLAPRAAEAQARGTLQATATVVDTRTSFEALQAARSAVQSAIRPDSSSHAVATVAQVSVDRPPTRPDTLVVTIAYARN